MIESEKKSKRLNVFFVTPEFVTEEGNFDGGLSNYIHKTSLELISRGSRVTVLVASDRNEAFNHGGIRVIRVNMRNIIVSLLSRITFRKFEPLLRWMFQAWKFSRKIGSMSLPPDSIIQFPSYTVPSLLFNSVKVPRVIRVSGFQPEIMHQYGVPKSSLAYRQVYWLEKKMFQNSRFIFGPSSTVSAILNKEFGVEIKIIKTPFTLPAIAKEAHEPGFGLNGKKYLLFFGTIGLLKGVSDIAEIIGDLLRKYPDLHFAFAGKDTDYGHGTMMEHVFRAAGEFRSRVIYAGKLRQNQLYPLIMGAHRVILPSRFDNLPNTCIEAMALGKIVVATKGSSLDELITEGGTGFLCEKQNPKSLLGAIDRSLLLDSGQELQMVKRAKDFTDGLNSDKVIGDLIDYYEFVLNSWEK
jgi:glycogen(starch) synthase